MASIIPPIDPGQFDDAEENVQQVPRESDAYIDIYEPTNDEVGLDWIESSQDEDEDDIDEEYDDSRVEDEDWENAERGPLPYVLFKMLPSKSSSSDFTKQYNRLRQHVAVRAGNAHGVSSALGHSAVASLPAVNHPKNAANSSNSGLKSSSSANIKDKTSDQLAALAKYNSRLAKIDVPYVMGVGVNRKGPSAHANLKDKSDRATNEQVLDPRTRLILFKMIGRGLIHEVNGCVSTGKEVVQTFSFSRMAHLTDCIGKCLPCCHAGGRSFGAENIQDVYPCIQRSGQVCNWGVPFPSWIQSKSTQNGSPMGRKGNEKSEAPSRRWHPCPRSHRGSRKCLGDDFCWG